jgi:hypothetical protein
VSATTATSAVSAATVGPLAGITDGLRIANTVDEALESPGPGDA